MVYFFMLIGNITVSRSIWQSQKYEECLSRHVSWVSFCMISTHLSTGLQYKELFLFLYVIIFLGKDPYVPSETVQVQKLPQETPRLPESGSLEIPHSIIDDFLNGTKNPISSLMEYSARARLKVDFQVCIFLFQIGKSSLLNLFKNIKQAVHFCSCILINLIYGWVLMKRD